MNTPSIRKLLLPLMALSVLLACAVPILPSPGEQNPTPNPGLIQTIVVATAGAAQTQTALVVPPASNTPTVTLLPTLPPTETQTPTATIIFIIPSSTFTPTATSAATETQVAGESCRLVSQTPASGTAIGPRERFDVVWTLRNTGSETWMSDSLDFFHSDGRDMHNADVVDLPRNVRTGDEITLEVEMRAPADTGTYTSIWTLGTRRETICMVSIRIVVR